MAELLVIVPSKGRPRSVAAVVDAWANTGAPEDGAELLFAVDADDSAIGHYELTLTELSLTRPWLRVAYLVEWQPMVHKLNSVAGAVAHEHGAVAFAGDDHRPRSKGWAARYVETLRDLGTGIAYGNDLVQGEKLPTQWAMTSDIVTALGRMVPAPVEHLYCDNSILDLGRAADCIRYLPDVRIEHCHPVAGRGAWDAGYERVNSRTQYAADHARYMAWRADGLQADTEKVRALRAAHVTA